MSVATTSKPNGRDSSMVSSAARRSVLPSLEIAAEHVDRLIGVPPHQVARARAEDDEAAVVADERAEAVVVALLAVAVAADEAQPVVPAIEHERVGEEPVAVVAHERHIGRFEADEAAVARDRRQQALAGEGVGRPARGDALRSSASCGRGRRRRGPGRRRRPRGCRQPLSKATTRPSALMRTLKTRHLGERRRRWRRRPVRSVCVSRSTT